LAQAVMPSTWHDARAGEEKEKKGKEEVRINLIFKSAFGSEC